MNKHILCTFFSNHVFCHELASPIIFLLFYVIFDLRKCKQFLRSCHIYVYPRYILIEKTFYYLSLSTALSVLALLKLRDIIFIPHIFKKSNSRKSYIETHKTIYGEQYFLTLFYSPSTLCFRSSADPNFLFIYGFNM